MSEISNTVAQRDNSAVNLIPQYQAEFSDVLPDHVKAGTFVRLAQAALRKDANLKQAAERDPGSLIFALREAARLGHEPGTSSFYLVPMGGRIEGWEGYRGVIERMYRAGAVASVKCEVVRANDTFDYDPAEDDKPRHKVDWFGDDRGKIIGAYAYAAMKDGATSRVVVVNRADIDKVKAESRGSDRPTSPWMKWEEQMVLKTVIHRLEPFVPTSSEYIREQLRAVRDVAAEPIRPAQPAPVPHDPATGEVVEGEVVD